MRILPRALITLIVPAGLLVWAYPPNTYFRYFDFPFFMTLASYVLMYVLLVCIAALVAPRLVKKVGNSFIRAVLQFVVAAVLFAVIAVLFGPIGLNVPGTRLRGIFFSEWQFLLFFFYVGLPLALTAAATSFLKFNNRA